ncbi:MAG: hypothetical protein JO211_13890, partial [Acidobacteriaceae bacterium]|nr:hypothetical protein [Acidobacteriaceae bacterium]
LEQHGFRITARRYTVVPLERVIPLRPENWLLRLGNHLLRVVTAVVPNLLAYEVVTVAER